MPRIPRRKIPFLLASIVVAVCFWAPPGQAQSSNAADNMRASDMRDRVDQEGSASRSLAKADRYLAQAEQMAVELAADPGNEKLQKKMAKRYKRAAENAAKAISMDSNLSGAYRTKGLAYLGLDEASSAHGACRMAFGLDRDDIEALHCFGKASLLRGIATDVEVTARELAKHDEAAFKSFREEIQAWVTENPDHEASERLSVYLNR